MPKSFADKLEKALTWKIRYISEKNFLLIISGIVGIVAGLAAVVLKETVHFIHHSLVESPPLPVFLTFFYPLIGLLLTVLLARVLYKEAQLGHAITDILYSISRKSSIMGRSKMYSRLFTSACTVGFGGSAGLESPIVLTGSAIGSNIAQLVNLNYKHRTLMIGCGTAAVISAIFNAPIAGLIFTIEVILIEVSLASFIPLLISSVSASLVSMALLGQDVLFSFKITDTFNAYDTPLYIALGIFCGSISRFFSKILHQTENFFQKFNNPWLKVSLGGAILCGMLYLVPPVYGEGYDMIKAMLNDSPSVLMARNIFWDESQAMHPWFFCVFLLLILFVKCLASAITIGCGGSGGTFAPSLFLGAITGYSFAKILNLSGTAFVSTSNFALVGMCGVLCGVQYAPLTAIFLIAELTGGYTLFVPLMIVSAISFSTVSFFNAQSMYINELKERGEYVAGDHDKRILSQLDINHFIEKDFRKVPVQATLGDLVGAISSCNRNLFPIINQDGELKGVITLDQVRNVMFDKEKQKTLKVADIMKVPRAYIEYGEHMESVMEKFEATGAWNLPVIKEGKYLGFVSKSRLFTVYREQLVGSSS
jgi:CIC family chloride channel protein